MTDLDSSTSQNSADGDIRVFLLDDHEVVRRGVAAALDAEPGIAVVGEASSAADALREIQRCHPHVAVLDVRLGDGSGLDVCRDITRAFPDVRSLILTSFENDRALVEAGDAGAAGFVLKQIRSNDLVQAIRLVADGRQLLDDAEIRMAVRRIQDESSGVSGLSPQERRIFELVGEGKTNREIAADMYLAEKTVKNYVSNMLSKLGFARRTEAAALAARLRERRRLSQ